MSGRRGRAGDESVCRGRRTPESEDHPDPLLQDADRCGGPAERRQPLFNQSTNVVIVETDAGLTGVGEGGAENTMEQCASMLIGEDPFRTDRPLADDVSRVLLSGRAGESPCARRAGCRALGSEGEGARGSRCTSFSAGGRASTSSATRRGSRRRVRQRSCSRVHRGRVSERIASHSAAAGKTACSTGSKR